MAINIYSVAIEKQDLSSQSTQEKQMATVSAFHSIKGAVHHVCSRCTLGNNIERENKRSGTGGKPRCDQCKDRKRLKTC